MITLDEGYKMVNELMDVVDSMSDWEYDFVNNVAEYEDSGRTYTADQLSKIEELHTRYC